MPRVELPYDIAMEQRIKSRRRHENMVKKFFALRQTLLEEYPDKWILWDGEKEKVVYASDTSAELLRHIDDNNIDTNFMEIEHLETNPIKWRF